MDWGNARMQELLEMSSMEVCQPTAARGGVTSRDRARRYGCAGGLGDVSEMWQPARSRLGRSCGVSGVSESASRPVGAAEALCSQVRQPCSVVAACACEYGRARSTRESWLV